MVISPVHFPTYNFWPRAKRGNSFFNQFFYFRRGSWALAYGLMAIAEKRGKECVRVWFPDYFCREPLEVLARFPIDIVYYPVQRNLTPDFETLGSMVKTGAPDAFVLVHYFGSPNDLMTTKQFCDTNSIELIEDCAHVMTPYDGVGTTGTLSIWSPWKFFPLPELGMVWVHDDLRRYVETLSAHRETMPLVKWWIKREVQRVVCSLGVNWYRRSYNSPLPQSPPLRVRGGWEGLRAHASANELSINLLNSYLCSVESIQRRHVENYHALESFFKVRYPDMLLFKVLPHGAVPYVFPCIMQRPAVEVSKKLIAHGIPAFLWPALPDAVLKNRAQYKDAHWLAEHILLLPIHQSVNMWQIEYMKRHITEIM